MSRYRVADLVEAWRVPYEAHQLSEDERPAAALAFMDMFSKSPWLVRAGAFARLLWRYPS